MLRTKNLLMLLCVLGLCASCSDDQEGGQANRSRLSFNLSQETSTQTRTTFSSGSTATQLSYAVYDAEGNHIDDLDGSTTMQDGTAQVEISLSKGDTYSVVFWTQAEESPYAIDFDAATVSYDEEKSLEANDDSYDAFYAIYTATVSGDATIAVTLKRPFAQLNFGSDDLATYILNGQTLTNTQITVGGAYNTLNLLSGEATYDGSSSGGTLTFAYAGYPKAQTFPYDASTDEDGNTSSSYAWLGMAYLFIGNDATTVDATLAWSETTEAEDGHNISANAIPVQRNYQTNVYGSLLTSAQTYSVTLSADFGSSDDVSYIAATVTSEEQIEALLAAGYDNVYVTLGTDMELSSSNILEITDEAEVTIDLNGNTLTAESGTTRNFYIDEGATLTVTDSSDDGVITNTTTGTSYGLFDVYGTLVIEGGTYKSLSTGDGALIKGRSGGTIIIEGGDFYTTDNGTVSDHTSWKGNCIISAYDCAVSIAAGTTFTSEGECNGAIVLSACTGVDGGAVTLDSITITTDESPGIELYATDATLSNTEITVNNDAEPDYYGAAIGISGGSKVTVSSGTYTGPYAVYIYNSGGYAYLNSGTYKGTTSVLKADSDVVVEGTWSDGREQGSYIYVSDGYYYGTYSIATSGTYTTLLSISGGYFTADPSSYLANGYSASNVTDTDGYTYKVSETTAE